MSESEIARLRKQMELEHEASVWALSGLRSGTAQHAFISARMRRMDTCYQHLSELVGEERATDALCELFDGPTSTEADAPLNRASTPRPGTADQVAGDEHPGRRELPARRCAREDESGLFSTHWAGRNPRDLRHYLLRLLLHGEYAALLSPSTQRVLDVGCGTGLWACEMARQWPQALITGLDLDLSHLPVSWPANCQFVAGDVLTGLPFADACFDFVHQRCLADTLSAPTWPMVARELARVTRPQGWIELVELGQSVTNPGPATSRYLHWWRELSERTGVHTTVVEHLGDLLQSVGLQQVAQRRITAPAGQWGGQAGTLLMTDMIETMQSMSQRFCTTLHLAPTLFDATIDALPAEWEAYHTAFHFYLAYGRKDG